MEATETGEKLLTADEMLEYERKERKRFDKWRERVRKNLPKITARVFALRKAFYTGCGFQWGVEKNLGQVICQVNDFEHNYYHGPDAMASRILLKILVESLHREVAMGERDILERAKAKG